MADTGHQQPHQDRAIRVSDELWNIFRQCAELNGETASDAMRALMQEYIDETTLPT